MKILVIEDDPTVGQYVKRGLEEQRWSVDLVTDGEDGERRAESEAYDLIILDMRLPRRSGLEVLHALRALPADAEAEAIQTLLYDIGKRHAFPNLRDWFGCLYQVLLGQQEGPRFGGFVALYGIPGTIGLIESALAREAAL